MAYIKGAFTILNNEYLGRLMIYLKIFSYLAGYRSVSDEVEIIKQYFIGERVLFQPGFSHAAY